MHALLLWYACGTAVVDVSIYLFVLGSEGHNYTAEIKNLYFGRENAKSKRPTRLVVYAWHYATSYFACYRHLGSL